MAEHSERIAKLNYKQAIILAVITAATSIAVTLISSGAFKSGQNETASAGQDCTALEKEQQDLEQKLKGSISNTTLNAMSTRYFPRSATNAQVEDSLKQLINDAQELQNQQSHYTYKLFLIKKIMLNKPRRNINTRLDGDDRSTYGIIQQILKELEFYDGAVDGERMKTYLALKKFQEAVNAKTPGYFEEKNYGIFGNATLVAVRNMHEI